jgi:hypothetical protein
VAVRNCWDLKGYDVVRLASSLFTGGLYSYIVAKNGEASAILVYINVTNVQ